MTQSIGRSYTFCAAHRIMGHEGKCKNLHGHTYTAEIILRLKADAKLDELGRILDYSVMDEVFGEWIKTRWEHAALLSEKDTLVPILAYEESKLSIFSNGNQPTAEAMAKALAFSALALMEIDSRFDHVELARVTIRESPTSFAEAS